MKYTAEAYCPLQGSAQSLDQVHFPVVSQWALPHFVHAHNFLHLPSSQTLIAALILRSATGSAKATGTFVYSHRSTITNFLSVFTTQGPLRSPAISVLHLEPSQRCA